MNEASGSKFVIRKWNIVNDNSKSNCGVGNEITLRLSGNIPIAGRNLAKGVAFNNGAVFS